MLVRALLDNCISRVPEEDDGGSGSGAPEHSSLDPGRGNGSIAVVNEARTSAATKGVEVVHGAQLERSSGRAKPLVCHDGATEEGTLGHRRRSPSSGSDSSPTKLRLPYKHTPLRIGEKLIKTISSYSGNAAC